MKIVIIFAKSRYRIKNLNNFAKNQRIGKYLLLNFYSYLIYLGFLLKKIDFFNFISIDNCISTSETKGFNFWMTGTIHKIPENKKYNIRNYVNMKNVFHDKDKVFQIFPINIKKHKLIENKKIIYVSSYDIRNAKLSEKIWEEIKLNSFQKFNYFDQKDFWNEKKQNELDDHTKFLIYRDLKNFQRKQLVQEISRTYTNKFELHGTNWDLIVNSKIKEISHNKAKKLYNGNICLDLGSKCGSLTLYPRSIDIIENGGLLLQIKQSDGENIFGKYLDEFTFDNFEKLNFKIKKILKDKEYFEELMSKQLELFKDAKEKIENQMDNLFKKD